MTRPLTDQEREALGPWLQIRANAVAEVERTDAVLRTIAQVIAGPGAIMDVDAMTITPARDDAE